MGRGASRYRIYCENCRHLDLGKRDYSNKKSTKEEELKKDLYNETGCPKICKYAIEIIEQRCNKIILKKDLEDQIKRAERGLPSIYES